MILISVYRGIDSGWFGVSIKKTQKDADRFVFYANRIHPRWHLKKEQL